MNLDDKNIGAGAGAAASDHANAAASAAGAMVDAYISTDCTVPLKSGTAFYNSVAAFKNAWNAWATGGDPDSPAGQLVHNGEYDAATVAAAQTLVSAVPAPCTQPAPPPPPAQTVTCSDGSVHPAGYVCPQVPVAPSGMPGWLKVLLWILLAGGVIAGSIWLFRYFGKKNELAAAESKRRPRKRGKRKKR